VEDPEGSFRRDQRGQKGVAVHLASVQGVSKEGQGNNNDCPRRNLTRDKCLGAP
jgi:hypothetical protein